VKIGVSLPEDLIAFADEVAERRGTSRSGLLAELLEAEKVRLMVGTYLDRYGWDIAEDDETWREYQRRRMAAEYGDDEW
jgi:metal-responsive CopG/Arc/MetJ family transcriptional regulator